uniref:Uncharacterized protein n=1 Tax=Corethron hystrix TaxID=216773 RepID=A0A7S1FS80_9STRA|mmetsp:Transcript_23592/g.53860  ORF Transcript_23592/g.53860 Transcript_23592/m.53860 type:complete len:177 (+) Transcript_23592:434-964(+)
MSTAADEDIFSSVTLQNVHKYSAYDLRRYLVRRGRLCDVGGDGASLTYALLLRRSVQVLHADAVAEEAGPAAAGGREERAKRSSERAEKKAAAVERSRRRREDPRYFEKRRAGVGDGGAIDGAGGSVGTGDGARNGGAAATDGTVRGEKNVERGEDRSDDPFRLDRRRFKIGGRCA